MKTVPVMDDPQVWAGLLDDPAYSCWNCDTAGDEPEVIRLEEELVCPRCGGSMWPTSWSS
jgi:hypothetical protein